MSYQIYLQKLFFLLFNAEKYIGPPFSSIDLLKKYFY